LPATATQPSATYPAGGTGFHSVNCHHTTPLSQSRSSRQPHEGSAQLVEVRGKKVRLVGSVEDCEQSLLIERVFLLLEATGTLSIKDSECPYHSIFACESLSIEAGSLFFTKFDFRAYDPAKRKR
jgi:hypothetical protein